MAWIQNPLEEEETKGQAAEGAKTSSESAVIAGDGAVAPAGAAAPDAGSQTTGTTGWTNLQTYLKANEGQAGGLADLVTSGVNKDVDAYKTTASSAADSAAAKINEKAGDAQAKTIATNLRTGDVKASKDAAKNFVNSSWDGGKVEDYTGDLTTGRTAVEEKLNSVDDRYGQQAALQDAYKGNAAYTNNMAALDGFLLFGDQGSKAKIDATKARTGETGSAFDAAAGRIGGTLTSASDRFAKNQQAIRDAAKERYAQLDAGAEGRVSDERKRQHGAVADSMQGIKDKVSKRNAAASGVSKSAEDYITANDKFGKDDVYTDAEIEALNALADINGTLAPVKKGTDSAYQVNSAAWEELLNSAKAAPPPPPAPVERNGDNKLGKMLGDGAMVVNNVVHAPEHLNNEIEKLAEKAGDAGRDYGEKVGEGITNTYKKRVPSFRR